ncbi:FAD-dependent oxidoreductase [Serinibacter arcticus]|uniref:FAD-dependent oxidoreductase n=1 Tax=Serinibacter arcticus TaxID=1655435 RepID=A0A2U1ZT80_9MICO|nr:FAD-dependent oxidoreductase [Serinibacter arcticus]PWD50195.1 FAD-dependent oxidoreductase [Serinibacter arcticus]
MSLASDDVDFDAVVVGAGPAGSLAALRLAQRGLSVVLIERGEAPGAKNLSGGVLYPYELATAIPTFAAQAPVERTVTRHVTTFLQADSAVSLDYAGDHLASPVATADTAAPNAVTVLRARLDPWLAARAEEAGAFLMPGVKVDALERDAGGAVVGVRAGEEVLRSRVVVAADGVNSFLARDAGLRPKPPAHHLAVGVKAVLAMEPGRIADRFGVDDAGGAAHAVVGDATAGVAGGGFVYTNRDSLSVGLVLRLDDLVRSGRTAHELFERFLAHPGLRRYLAGAEAVEYGSHLVAEGGLAMVGEVVHDGLVLTGDAAGLTINSGLVLRGMDLAVASGIAAGDAVADAIEAGDVTRTGLERYRTALEATTAMADLRTYERAPAFFSRRGPYGPWGRTAADVLRAAYTLDGAPRRPVRTLVRDALRRSDASPTTWAQDAWAAVRSL